MSNNRSLPFQHNSYTLACSAITVTNKNHKKSQGILTIIVTTTYYVKSYASNSAGTAYGNEISFITTTIPPVLSTIEITSITSTTANSGGNITSAGGTITASGICWSAKTNPTIADSKTSENIGSYLKNSSNKLF